MLSVISDILHVLLLLLLLLSLFLYSLHVIGVSRQLPQIY
jgi:hypothetical protein